MRTIAGRICNTFEKDPAFYDKSIKRQMVNYRAAVPCRNSFPVYLTLKIKISSTCNRFVSLSKAHLLPKVLVIPRKRWLRPNMTEQLFPGTLRINQPTNQFLHESQNRFEDEVVFPQLVVNKHASVHDLLFYTKYTGLV